MMGTVMGRKATELSPLEVSRLKAPGLHFVGGVAGLALQVSQSGARSWILRIKIGTKRRDIGLGGFPDVPLAQAKEKARQARDKVKEGKDPIEEARAAKSALMDAQSKAFTFDQAGDAYIKAHEAGWKSLKHAAQWRTTLTTYASPIIGAMQVSDVDLTHVMQILDPIWKDKTETASRLRGRIESVLNWATARGYRTGLNPARWRGHLDNLLPARGKIQKVEHHAALSYKELSGFILALRQQAGMGARALEFAILTAARSGEVRGATWAEIDTDAATWTIPSERMKVGKEHRVPLSDAALTLLAALPRMAGTDLVFPNTKGAALSDMTLTAVLRRMVVDSTAHGFRSTFRDWAGETTAYPREVIEHALAHQLKDKAEAAYARGSLFGKRRRLMDDWAIYCVTQAAKAGEVVPIGRTKKTA